MVPEFSPAAADSSAMLKYECKKQLFRRGDAGDPASYWLAYFLAVS
jgi:hypothetical protein